MAKKTKLQEQLRTKTDEFGNAILAKDNGVRIIIVLKLRGEGRSRRLGVLNIATNTLYIKRKRSQHLFKKNNSYGFNYHLLESAKRFEFIRLEDEYNEWLIPRQYLLEKGVFLHFKQIGFERQIFVPLALLEEFKRKNKF